MALRAGLWQTCDFSYARSANENLLRVHSVKLCVELITLLGRDTRSGEQLRIFWYRMRIARLSSRAKIATGESMKMRILALATPLSSRCNLA
jgi:hypothetical protein